MTLAELRKGVIAARWGELKLTELAELLHDFALIPVDEGTAEAWAQLSVRCDRLGRRKSENDLWIAATAKQYGLPLASLDKGHYDTPGLTVIREDGSEIVVPD